MLKAVTVLLFNELNQILAVSRKDDITKFGLVGGKVDSNETLEEAAVRETKEETGLIIYNLKKIFEDSEDRKFWTVCFTADYTGTIHTSEKGLVKWVNKEILFTGPFGNYNKKLFVHIGK